jgi:endonuclease/exonuclease/phosphatase family metal-dependent hydrolase
LISRWPVQASTICDISYPEREPRRAICCEIVTPAGPLRVVATHLGLAFGERRCQARALLDLIGDSAMTTVALGDFNDWFWVGSVRRVLARALPGWTRLRTFPSICPLLRLDRIYCRPREALVRGRTDVAARAMSDHLPVVADVCVRP